MKKSGLKWLPLGFWITYAVLVLIILIALRKTDSIAQDQFSYALQLIVGIAIVPSIFGFYTFYNFIFPRFFQQQKFSLTIFYGILVSLGCSLLGSVALYFVANFGLSCHFESNGLSILMMTFIAFVCGSIALIIRGFITMFEEMTLKESLQEQNHQMEMALVKAQLDPHFLFNTINNIDVLIVRDPNEASAYLNKLSDIMRFMLFENKTEYIPLTKEIEYIKKFIALQQIRTSNPSYAKLEITGTANGHKIAPMVFIPFIENAFKHTTNKKMNDAIQVNINIEHDYVQMICSNKKDQNRTAEVESNGLGNELIEKRLQLIYPETHDLEITNSADLYSVNLKLEDV